MSEEKKPTAASDEKDANITEDVTIKEAAKDPSDDKNDDPKEPVHSYAGEDRIERTSLSLKEKFKAEKELLRSNMDGMDKKEKISYLVYYYKWYALLTAIVIIAIGIGIRAYLDSKKPRALYIDILNCNMEADDHILKDYFDLQYGKAYKMYIGVADTIGIEHKKKYPTAASYNSFPAACAANMYDVIVTDRDGLDWCTANSSIYAPETIISEPLLNKVSDSLISTVDGNGNLVTSAIDISDTDFAKALKLPYEKVYLCFPGNLDENIENAEKLLKFIYNFE